MLASRFQTKKSLSNQKFAIYNVKNEVSFHLFKYQPWYKTLQLPQIINWKLSIHCLAPQHILQFFHFCCTYCLCLCLWQLCSLLCGPPQCSTEQSRYWKKKVSAMGDFSWEILTLCLWRKEVPLSHWFVVSGDRIFSWHNASCLQTFLSWNLAFDFGRNTTTLSKFVGYMDLTNFRQISPGMITNETVLGNFDKYLSHGVHWGNTPCIFFSYSNFRCWYLDNLSEYRKNPPHFRWLMPC